MEINLTKKQSEAWDYLEDSSTNYIVFGGAAGGAKSYLSAIWLWYLCATYDNVHCFVGREELKRLRESWVMTWHKMIAQFKLPKADYNAKDNYFIFPNQSRIDLLDLRYMPSDPLYERYGSVEYTCGVIEEGGEVAFEAFDTLKSRIGRYNNAEHGITPKILITCNPKKNWLYNQFYLPWKRGSLSEDMAFIQALPHDNPHLPPDYIEGLKKITDKARKQRLLYGEWEYDDSDNSLISFDSIQDLFTNVVQGGKRYITADIARYGADATVIGYWNGLRLEEIIKIDKSDLMHVVGVINKLREEKGVALSNVIVDEQGVGGGVKDALKCKGFIANGRPFADGKNFSNIKSQCFFKLADYINDGKIWAVDKFRESITQELEMVKSDTITGDGKQSVLGKDKVRELLGRSPDFADMMMMRMYYELRPTYF